MSEYEHALHLQWIQIAFVLPRTNILGYQEPDW